MRTVMKGMIILFVVLISGLVSSQDVSDELEQVCASSIGREAYYISGGGEPLNVVDKPIAMADIAALIEGNIPKRDMNKSREHPVGILVVDDFSNEIESEVVDRLTHGELVVRHIGSLLRSLEYTPTTQIDSDIIFTEWERTDWPDLLVVQIDYAESDPFNQTLPGVLEKIERAITMIQERNIATRFVINMSFVFLPCIVVETILDWVGQERILDNDVERLARWLAVIQGALDATESPINLTHENIVFVAAAGNYGSILQGRRELPFFPGGWPEVISVSAVKGGRINEQRGFWEEYQHWPPSNFGEVMLPGGPFRDEAGGYLYLGTSFAAPIFSVVAALNLTQDEVGCPFDLPPASTNFIYELTRVPLAIEYLCDSE